MIVESYLLAAAIAATIADVRLAEPVQVSPSPAFYQALSSDEMGSFNEFCGLRAVVRIGPDRVWIGDGFELASAPIGDLAPLAVALRGYKSSPAFEARRDINIVVDDAATAGDLARVLHVLRDGGFDDIRFTSDGWNRTRLPGAGDLDAEFPMRAAHRHSAIVELDYETDRLRITGDTGRVHEIANDPAALERALSRLRRRAGPRARAWSYVSFDVRYDEHGALAAAARDAGYRIFDGAWLEQ